jgi:hypothetical protein
LREEAFSAQTLPAAGFLLAFRALVLSERVLRSPLAVPILSLFANLTNILWRFFTAHQRDK